MLTTTTLPRLQIPKTLAKTQSKARKTVVATAEKITVSFEFCPTGEGGGIDPTCSPGGIKHAFEIKAPPKIREHCKTIAKAMEAEIARLKELFGEPIDKALADTKFYIDGNLSQTSVLNMAFLTPYATSPSYANGVYIDNPTGLMNDFQHPALLLRDQPENAHLIVINPYKGSDKSKGFAESDPNWKYGDYSKGYLQTVGSSVETVVAHEIGHSVEFNAFGFGNDDWARVCRHTYVEDIETKISIYAGQNIHEAFAESFAKYANKDFEPGKGHLPKFIEEYFLKHLPRKQS